MERVEFRDEKLRISLSTQVPTLLTCGEDAATSRHEYDENQSHSHRRGFDGGQETLPRFGDGGQRWQ